MNVENFITISKIYFELKAEPSSNDELESFIKFIDDPKETMQPAGQMAA